MKSLKFLRNVAVYGVHRAQGTVHEIADKEAGDLIRDGAAIEAPAEEKKPKKASEKDS